MIKSGQRWLEELIMMSSTNNQLSHDIVAWLDDGEGHIKNEDTPVFPHSTLSAAVDNIRRIRCMVEISLDFKSTYILHVSERIETLYLQAFHWSGDAVQYVWSKG